jgi:transposase InsO family protein
MRAVFDQLSAETVEFPPSTLCDALSLSRATHYRRLKACAGTNSNAELRDHIQRIALAWPAYGYRRITHELHRQDIAANHKHVLRLMREDNLLCLRKKSCIRTTDSRHSLARYPNLVPQINLTSINQLWVADITYIRLKEEFVYLAVVLDAFSRRLLGWALEHYLEAELALAALRMALAQREITSGLVHHSDQGVQYASLAYTDLLKEQGIRISMSRRGNAYDNAKAESFIKTLKYEEVYLFEYESISEARARIKHFLEEVYNQKRLHSAIGYRPPAEFEQQFHLSTSA